ncbi:hypothetical protein DFJ74DRAFT_770422 [Hyaloraphidium curvatum]|nr:hypothetical protein DFJ74DRAFT_770422 [Hyaloraphidium curvatum]
MAGRRLARYLLAAAGALLAACGARGQSGLGALYEALEPALDAWDTVSTPIELGGNIERFFDNTASCVRRGGTARQCGAIPPFCLLADQYFAFVPYNPIPAAWNPFVIDCGTGECFQCCSTAPGECHTSFVGFPVVNCNHPNYGAGTRPAGMTMVLEQDTIGKACLFIRQICDHLPLCNPAAGGARLQHRAPEPPPALAGYADAASAAVRARSFGMQLQWGWQAYLDGFSTEVSSKDLANPSAPISRNAEIPTLRSIPDWLTQRGRSGWLADISSKSPFGDPSLIPPRLRILGPDNSTVVAPASELALLVAWGTQVLLSAVGNLHARFSFAESRVWRPAAAAAHLAAAVPGGDAEAAAWNQSTGPALAVLRDVLMLQDWRLLAAPAPGEPAQPDAFQDVAMGRPARITRISLSRTHGTTETTVSMELSISDPEAGTSPRRLTIDWGDHSPPSHFPIPSSQPGFSLSHAYPRGPTARTLVAKLFLENASGLRSAAFLPLRIPGAPGAPVPSSRLRSAQPFLKDVTVRDVQLDLTDPRNVGLRFLFSLRAAAGSTELSGISSFLEEGGGGWGSTARSYAVHNAAGAGPLAALAIGFRHAGLWCRYTPRFRLSDALGAASIDPSTGRRIEFGIPVSLVDVRVWVRRELEDGSLGPAAEAGEEARARIISRNGSASAIEVSLCDYEYDGRWITYHLDRVEVDLLARAGERYAAAWAALAPSADAGATGIGEGAAAGWAEARPGAGVVFADPQGAPSRAVRGRWRRYDVEVWDPAWTTTRRKTAAVGKTTARVAGKTTARRRTSSRRKVGSTKRRATSTRRKTTTRRKTSTRKRTTTRKR